MPYLSSSSPRALPVIPAHVASERGQYRRHYESAAARFANNDVPHRIVLRSIREVLDERIRLAEEERQLIESRAFARAEYVQFAVPLDIDESSTPEARLKMFAQCQYLPAYEIFSYLALGETTKAADTTLAEIAFALLVEMSEGKTDILIDNDVPEAVTKVSDFMRLDDGVFAFVHTKVGALALSSPEHLLEVKSRRAGVINLEDIEDPEVAKSFKVLASVAGEEDVTEVQMEGYRKYVADFLADTQLYHPVLDRVYCTRSLLSVLSFGKNADATRVPYLPIDPNSQR